MNDFINEMAAAVQMPAALLGISTPDALAEAPAVTLEELEALFPGYPIHMDPLSLSVACHIGPGARAVTVTKALEK